MGRRRLAWQLARGSSSVAIGGCVTLKKYAVPRQIKPGILKLTTRGGQSNLRTVLAAKKKAVIVSFR